MNDKSDVAASGVPAHTTTEQLANGRSWPPWRRMGEEHPENNQPVLFWYGGECYLGVFSSENMRFWASGSGILLQSLWWLPAPDAPDGEGGGD